MLQFQPILGPDGRVINKPSYDEFAVPHVIQFSTLFNNAWKVYWSRRHDAALRDSEENARAMELDIALAGLMQERYLATVSLKWHVEVDNERDSFEKSLKDGLTKILQGTPFLQKMLWNCLEAIWYGRSGVQLAWEWQQQKLPMLGNPTSAAPMRALCVKAHQPVHGDSIVHEWDGTPGVMLHGSEAERIPNARIIRGSIGKAVALDGTFRQRFIIHRHLSKATDFWMGETAEAIHGIGVRNTLYWTWWLRNEWLGSICDWVQRAGLGIRIWRYQMSNPASKIAVEEAARAYSADKVNLLIPVSEEGMEGVENIESVSTGADLLNRLIEYLDDKIERYIIGQTLSSDSEGNGLGGSGVASLHAETKSKIIAFDANNLGETLTADLLKPVQRWTYPDLRDVPARFVFDIDTPDPQERLAAIKSYFDMGGSVPDDDARGVLGLSAPQEGDKVLSMAAMQQAETQMQMQTQAAQLQQQAALGVPPAPPAMPPHNGQPTNGQSHVSPAPVAPATGPPTNGRFSFGRTGKGDVLRYLKSLDDGERQSILRAVMMLLPDDVKARG